MLSESAIIIEAGDGYEDTLMSVSYIDLRQAEGKQQTAAPSEKSDSGYFVPDTDSSGDTVGIADDKTTPSADNNRVGPADE